MKDLRVNIRVYNNQLRERREKLGMTQKEIAATIGCSLVDYAALESVKASPVHKKRLCGADDCPVPYPPRTGLCKAHFSAMRPTERMPPRFSEPVWRSMALHLADFFGTTCEELFPEIVKHGELSQTVKLDEHEAHAFLASGEPSFVLPGDEAEQNELVRDVRQALATLSPRERLIVEKHYGLEGNDEKTFEELESDFGRTHSRLQQINKKSLRKIALLLRPHEEK